MLTVQAYQELGGRRIALMDVLLLGKTTGAQVCTYAVEESRLPGVNRGMHLLLLVSHAASTDDVAAEKHDQHSAMIKRPIARPPTIR